MMSMGRNWNNGRNSVLVAYKTMELFISESINTLLKQSHGIILLSFGEIRMASQFATLQSGRRVKREKLHQERHLAGEVRMRTLLSSCFHKGNPTASLGIR